ncbi:RadC family protein [Brevundimonas sp. UBA5936]|jgi:DNA repair protein RadC|uniref:RadC family protein n=1 Tax=Brevundimonas sp. UBA5936 TaxID=1946133 RepID=UPI0025C40BCA|nr:DNA repair protein RadC [Brevundimonas sp. UBA5936]
MRPLPDLGPAFDPTARSPDASALANLDDRALLGLLLGRNLRQAPGASVDALFDHFGDLATIASADVPELARAGGLGPMALTDLKLFRILSERLARAEASRRPVITTWSALLAYVRVALAGEPREQFRALFLDKRNRLLRDELVAYGTIDHAPVYPREVVRRALEVSAASIILVHNHPSGDPEPSRADIEMTRKVVEAAKVFDIQVHDHLVVGRDGTASLRSLGHFR